MENNQFIQTDDLQYLRKIGDTEYQLVEARYAEDKYIICSGSVDVEELLDKAGNLNEEGKSLVKTYYGDVQDFNYTDKDTRNQLLAEMYFESTAYYELSYEMVPESAVEEALRKRMEKER